MAAYEVFRTVIDKYLTYHADFIGHYAFESSKQGLRTYFAVIIFCSFLLINITSTFTSDRQSAIICAFFWLFSIQGLVKSYICLTSTADRKEALEVIENLYKANKFNIENRIILLNFIRWNLLFVKLITYVFLATISVCICVPLGLFFITGRMEPMLPSHIPFVPTDQLWGYLIHTIYFTCTLMMGYAGTVANEVLLLTSTMHIWPMYKIMDQAIKGLNQAIGSLEKETVRNSSWLHFRVRNIALMHKEIYFYVSEMSRINYPIFTSELYTDQWSLCLLIYVIIVLKWPPAILLCVTVFVKLFLYCAFGTAVDILNERVYESLVNIDCYLIPTREQKIVLFMIHNAQHPQSFMAGRVRLNIETFVDVLKTVYSFTMVLLESA